jgi:hypothetical protein
MAVDAEGDHAYLGSGPSLIVADVSDPSSLAVVGEVVLPGWIQAVASSGSHVYAANVDAWYSGAHPNAGLSVVALVKSLVPDGYLGGITDVAVSGDFAYVIESERAPMGWGNSYLRVFDVSTPSAPVEVGRLDDLNSGCNGIAVSGDYAYIASRRYNGNGIFLVVDISEPTSPVVVGSTDAGSGGVTVSGSYAFTGGFPGIQAIDISSPTAPTVVASLELQSGMYVEDVEFSGGHVYATGGIHDGEDWQGSMSVIDVGIPTNPVEVGSVEILDFPYGVAASNDHAYVAAQSAGLRIVDASTPSAPVEVSCAETPGQSEAVAVEGSYGYIAASDGLHVIDVSTLASPVEIGSADAPGRPESIAVSGGNAYVCDTDGLRVFDVSTPTIPVEIGLWDTVGGCSDVAVSSEYAYVTADDGLHVIDVSTPAIPVEIGDFYTPSRLESVAVSGTHVYVVGDDLTVIDVSSPANPVEVGWYYSGGVGISVAGTYAFVSYESLSSSGQDYLKVFDVSDPTDPGWVASAATTEAGEVVVADNHAYVATRYNGVSVVDVSRPTDPNEVVLIETEGLAADVAVASGYAFVVEDWFGMEIFEASPIFIDGFEPGDTSRWSATVP